MANPAVVIQGSFGIMLYVRYYFAVQCYCYVYNIRSGDSSSLRNVKVSLRAAVIVWGIGIKALGFWLKALVDLIFPCRRDEISRYFAHLDMCISKTCCTFILEVSLQEWDGAKLMLEKE